MRIANMLQVMDAHACGEPGRVIIGGVLDVPCPTRSVGGARRGLNR